MSVSWNRLLLDRDRELYKETIEEMFRVAPREMAGKPSRANVQQAFMVNAVRHFSESTDSVLCAGSFTDTAMDTLDKTGYNIVGVDPNPGVRGIQMYLHEYVEKFQPQFDLVFSTSVIEHVPDNEQFLDSICRAIKPGGYGLLTMDYKDGWKHGMIAPGTCYRLHTLNDIENVYLPILDRNNCEPVGELDYSGEPDFVWENITYCFATLVFRKRE